MALDSFKAENNQYRQYQGHKYNDKLEEMVDELQDRFPEGIEVDVDFIEASPNIGKDGSNYNARAYSKDYGETSYIRVSEKLIENSSEERVRQTVLHEMVHVYLYKNGFRDDSSDASALFIWLCGAVGTTINQVHVGSREYSECMEPFINDKESP